MLANKPDGGSALDERRRYERVRTLFHEAFESLKPFFDPANRWGDHNLDHLAYRMLRNRYPDLRDDEVRVFIHAAERACLDEQRAPSR